MLGKLAQNKPSWRNLDFKVSKTQKTFLNEKAEIYVLSQIMVQVAITLPLSYSWFLAIQNINHSQWATNHTMNS